MAEWHVLYRHDTQLDVLTRWDESSQSYLPTNEPLVPSLSDSQLRHSATGVQHHEIDRRYNIAELIVTEHYDYLRVREGLDYGD